MTDSTTIIGRAGGWRLPIIGVGAVLAVLLLILLLVLPHEAAQASSTTWTTNLTSGVSSGNNLYGYSDDFGSLSDSTFVYDGTTYTVEFIRWDSRKNKILLVLDSCLKPSDFSSLEIGSTEYSNPNYTENTDEECRDNSLAEQEFEFHYVYSNPLPVSTTPYQITLTLGSSSAATPSPTPSPTPTGSPNSTTTIAAERVSTTAVNFGRSLTQPKGLAWDGTTLYMVDNGTDALYTVSPSTGRATRVSTRTTRFGLDVSTFEPRDLAWSGSTLYMITSSRLYKLNRTTGVATSVGSFGTDISNATGLAWKRSSTATSTGITGKPDPGRLYMVDTNNDALYIVDTATGSATPTDAFPVDSSVRAFGGSVRTPNGISWAGSDLYMVSNSPGKLHLVNETTGTVTNLGEFGIKSPTDLAWNGSKLFVLDDYTNALYTIPGIGPSDPPAAASSLQTEQIGSATRFGLTSATLNAPQGLTMVNADLYMVEDNTDFLYTVNRTTGVAGKVGSAGLGSSALQPRGIAWDGTTMYMVTRSALYEVNRAYGTTTHVGPLGTKITDAAGLAWSGEKLYMVDRATDALYTVATSTGAASRVDTDVDSFGKYIYNPSGLTWVGPPLSEVEDDNELPSLYMGDHRGYLWKVDKDTGSAELEGQLGTGTGNITGLAWFDETSTLYFVDDTSDALKTVTNFPKFLPNAGDLYYNGSNFADGFVRWDNPKWVDSDLCEHNALKCATYEHDLILEWKSRGGWFNLDWLIPYTNIVPNVNFERFCTTWSDLPVPYNDCPTAGVRPLKDISGTDTVELSFGTFKAPQIERGQDYYGFWIFKNQRGSGSTTEVRLYGQEGRPGRGPTENTRCRNVRAEDIWCVEGRQGGSIIESSITWSYGTPSYTVYSRP
ncbi:MAG: DUF4394 domain-containing protein [Dehalococcoidia bacterium]|nr:DUF4394 domain-containing protein [Dehalococcoidia bacterium]